MTAADPAVSVVDASTLQVSPVPDDERRDLDAGLA